MMQLPSESHSNIIIPILTTLGAGGILKLYAQFQAGRTSVRAELQTRVRSLEELVGGLQKEIGDLREQKGAQQATIAALQKQNAEQQARIDVLEKRHPE